MKPVVPLTIDDSQNFRDWGFKHGTAPKLKKNCTFISTVYFGSNGCA